MLTSRGGRPKPSSGSPLWTCTGFQLPLRGVGGVGASTRTWQNVLGGHYDICGCLHVQRKEQSLQDYQHQEEEGPKVAKQEQGGGSLLGLCSECSLVSRLSEPLWPRTGSYTDLKNLNMNVGNIQREHPDMVIYLITDCSSSMSINRLMGWHSVANIHVCVDKSFFTSYHKHQDSTVHYKICSIQ